MASDDFIRIIYRPKREVHTPSAAKAAASSAKARRNRTSVSIEPDLYKTFVTIVGDAVQARTRIRQWATDADALRAGPGDNTGVSRLVHKQMLAVIRRVVDAGLTVIHQGGKQAVQQLLEVRIEHEPSRATKTSKAAETTENSASDGTSDGAANGTAMADATKPTSETPAAGLDDWDSFSGGEQPAAKAAKRGKKAPSKKGKGADPFAPVAIPVADEFSDAASDAPVADPVVAGASDADEAVELASHPSLPPQRTDFVREPAEQTA